MKKIQKKINIYITHYELPLYAYYLYKYFFNRLKKYSFVNLKIISTNYHGKKNYNKKNDFFKNIKWINSKKIYNWTDLGLECPDIYFQSGWNIDAFKYLATITKIQNKKSKIILTTDHAYKKNYFQKMLESLFFKLFMKKNYDFAWVPGLDSKKLMLDYGFQKKDIFTGLYCSLINVFKNQTSIYKRKKQFIYVGQFIRRKNIDRLVNAFTSLRPDFKKKWKMILVGKRDLRLNKMQSKENIKIINVQKPSKLNQLYNQSLFFVLPSLKENWGLVVHEAALTGCYLLLSQNVGSITEFARRKNSIKFDPKSQFSIKKSLEHVIMKTNKQLIVANKLSEKLGNTINYEKSFNQFFTLIQKCLS